LIEIDEGATVMSRIVIDDWLIWGNLLKTWTTGKDYLPTRKLYPRPRSLDELRRQLVASGAGSIPDWVVDLELVSWNEKRLLIELPSRENILDAETFLKSGKPYPLPDFYRTTGGMLPTLDTLARRLAFHTMRIGEHAVGVIG
jgi:hypothetical protein